MVRYVLNETIRKLKSINLWHFVWLSVVFSEIFTAIMGLFLKGKVTYDYLVTGGVVSLAASFLVIYLIKMLRDMEKELLRNGEELQKSRELYHLLVETAPDVIYSLKPDGKIASLNHAFEKITGWDIEETVGKHFTELIHPEDLKSAVELFALVSLERQTPPLVELRVLSKSGEYLTGEFSLAPLVENGNVSGGFGVARDISRYKQLEDLLSKQFAAMEASMDGLAILGSDEKYVYLNDAHAKLYVYDNAGRFLGETWKIFFDAKEAARLENEVIPDVRKKGQWRGEATGKKADGSLFQMEMVLTLIEHGYIVCVARDITELKCNVEIIKHMAYYDTLTGLPNRLLFNDRLCNAIVEAKAQNSVLAVMFLDIDRFKAINDTLGHNFGDLLIQAMAKRLKALLRKKDTVTRLGGDEFLLLLTDLASWRDANMYAQKIIDGLSMPFMLDGRELFVTASIGVSLFPADGTDLVTLVKNADIAMYSVKEQGRNGFQFYIPSMNAQGLENHVLKNNLHKALDRKELMVHYQPQFNLTTGEITGIEALMRWRHPELGLISLAEFIPIAEEAGIIVSIGEWLMHTACKQHKEWQRKGLSLGRMAVNLSMRQFQQSDLLEIINKILKDTGLDAGSLELELTESIVMQNTDAAISRLRELRSSGINLSIDDFGTGYSSLNYLKYLPVNRLKIAQHFAGGITKDPNDEAISRAIITLAHNFNLKVVAEGVETKAQLDFYRTHSCDEVQGFLLSKPLSSEDMTLFLISSKDVKSQMFE